MSSEKQLEASRRNGAKSRGPLNPFARDSHNARLLARTILLEGESRERFDELVASLHADLQPESSIERMLIQTMIVARWRQMRFWSLEQAGISYEVRKQDVELENPPTRDALAFFALGDKARAINQSEMRFDRQFNRALATFRAMQSTRKNKKEGPNPGSD